MKFSNFFRNSQLFSPQSASVGSGSQGASRAVYLNFNESPFGPLPPALDAARDSLPGCGRYGFGAIDQLHQALALELAVPADHLTLYPGSNRALHYAAATFTGPGRSLVVATPGYPICELAARRAGADVHKVPLRKDGAHDLARMCAVEDAGLIYLCNPNNPTGTITPHNAILQALAQKPGDAVLLVDEAYLQFCDEPSMLPWIEQRADLIVLRTFSKIYGLAGLRIGMAMAQPQTLQRITTLPADDVSITAAQAALASLGHGHQVAQRKQVIIRARNETIDWLQSRDIPCTRSQSSCFMMKVGEQAPQIIQTLADNGVHIGRTWPEAPEWVRVTVGSLEEMEVFKSVMSLTVCAHHHGLFYPI
ncbi:aminotransferase class I/II-fold pyridoxal phosphate-dependent enzyme [Pseudomonas sp. DTU12.1]|uniref:aminotransferase class I/II-fold pyridoxal phosphate-dependent enzyme n=1 Tax=Pseudomonas sp. DTU12.1 TaxID=2654238 RepID=UPI00132F2589|nr:aminotransferase class I/II-fold pyridoxal phosphate-dependent enzyme [Pseudomonas sp. DTU12.1]QHG24206.1 aminotransferase class I/II-fold pyridoxal phosphate-dependent enzyme [Pseudomonas sp. DTU12.1]